MMKDRETIVAQHVMILRKQDRERDEAIAAAVAEKEAEMKSHLCPNCAMLDRKASHQEKAALDLAAKLTGP